MQYKVTPMMPSEPEKKVRQPREPGQPRKKRKSAVYDHEGHEILITLMCLKCRSIKPLAQFGLRKMGDGAIRNQPWCRTCRSGAGTKKGAKEEPSLEPTLASEAVPPPLAAAAEPRVLSVNTELQDESQEEDLPAPMLHEEPAPYSP